jgi:acyl-homoserine lactone synthase
MHIETGAARAMENRLFRSMFEERKRVFVDLLRWDVLVVAGHAKSTSSTMTVPFTS